MLQFCREKLAAIWQDRFRYGVGINVAGGGVTRHKQGTVYTGNGPMLVSPGTGHWPWYLCEFAFVSGKVPSWHIGLLGFTVGMTVQHDINELGEVCGPDFKHYYWFFNAKSSKREDIQRR
jgi:hypothetical protein